MSDALSADPAGCRIEDARVLVADLPGQCVVRATKAPDGVYGTVASGDTAISVDKAEQAPLEMTFKAGAVEVEVRVTGGSGTGVVWVEALDGSARGCTVSDRDGSLWLRADTRGTCEVMAFKEADTRYGLGWSALTSVELAKFVQAPVTLAGAAGVAGTPLTLVGRGGSGTGAFSFGVVEAGSTGCRISPGTHNVLLATGQGTCQVVVVRAGDENHVAARSAVTAVRIAPQATHGSSVRRPGSVGALKVKGPAHAKKRSMTWARPTSGGTATGYRVSISKGARQLVSVSVSRPKLVVKRSALSRGRLKVTVTAYNSAGGSAPVSRKFRVR